MFDKCLPLNFQSKVNCNTKWKRKSEYWENSWGPDPKIKYLLFLGNPDSQFTEISDHTVFVLHLRYQIPSCGFNFEEVE